jgi:hypothetical protein
MEQSESTVDYLSRELRETETASIFKTSLIPEFHYDSKNF